MSSAILLAGRKGVSQREGLEIWYQRREETSVTPTVASSFRSKSAEGAGSAAKSVPPP